MGRARQNASRGSGGRGGGSGGRGSSAGRGRGGATSAPITQRAIYLGGTTLTPPENDNGTPSQVLRNISYDVTYDTCFYSHTFPQGTFGAQPAEIDNTFVPKFALFETTSNLVQPSAGPEYWMAVNFTSKFDGPGLTTKTRPALNLVIALDISGSMGEVLGESKSKISLAKECILSVTSQLRDDDCFGLMVFNTEATVITPLTLWGNIDNIELAKTVNRLKPGGGTILDTGISQACQMIRGAPEGDGRSSRICFLTDMEATNNTDEPAFLLNVKNFSNEGIYTTIVGIGVDLTRESVIETSRTPGCGYCNVYSDDQFRDLMNKEFNYFVTPIAFNIQLDIINQSQWKFYKAYGSAELTQVPLDVVRFSSEFPCSMDEAGRARAGAYIFSLRPIGERTPEEPRPDVVLKVKWEDHQGITRIITQNIPFDARCYGIDTEITTTPATSGIRKSLVLIRFVEFVQQQVELYNNYIAKWNAKLQQPAVELPPVPDRGLIQNFVDYYRSEQTILQDATLQGELEVLNNLLSVVITLPTIQ